MRRLIALISLAAATIATLAATLVVLPAGAALAGGPTSVLIVNYEGARSAGALTGSAAYDDLAAALDIFAQPTGEQEPRAQFMESRVRLTWLIHDVTPWRVDGLAINGTEVWVDTAVSSDGTSPFEQPTTRHRAKDAALLLATLARLGVIGDQAATTQPAAGQPLSTPARSAVAPQPPAVSNPASPTPVGSAAGVPALAGTFAGGLLLGALGASTLKRRASRDATAGAPPDDPVIASADMADRAHVAEHVSSEVPTVGFSQEATHASAR